MRAILEFFCWAKEFLKNIVYPSVSFCPGCGREFDPRNIKLCSECIAGIEFIKDKYCIKCGKFVPDSVEYCRDCEADKRWFELARAVGTYTGRLREIILKFKYENYRKLSVPLGDLLAIYTRRFYHGKEVDFITYIPAHKSRYKKRGYNQSLLLSKRLGIKIKRPIRALLKRKRSTEPQSNLSRRDRKQNMEGVFTVTSVLPKGKNILLVDDIFTTGATVNQASKVLLQAGARSVQVITLATGKDLIN